jgi:hypothetical protein
VLSGGTGLDGSLAHGNFVGATVGAPPVRSQADFSRQSRNDLAVIEVLGCDVAHALNLDVEVGPLVGVYSEAGNPVILIAYSATIRPDLAAFFNVSKSCST